MEFDKFKILIKGLKAVYTSERFLPDADSVKIWYSMLKDIPYDVLSVAIQKYIMTEKFPPTIADLRALTSETIEGKPLDWGKAWETVLDSVSKYGWYHTEEGLACLDDLTREAVKRIGYDKICMSENIVADRANFRTIYEGLLEDKTRQNKISANVKALDSGLSGKKLLEDK